jgi:hypothetical protein
MTNVDETATAYMERILILHWCLKSSQWSTSWTSLDILYQFPLYFQAVSFLYLWLLKIR